MGGFEVGGTEWEAAKDVYAEVNHWRPTEVWLDMMLAAVLIPLAPGMKEELEAVVAEKRNILGIEEE